jgi:hypothetical protein
MVDVHPILYDALATLEWPASDEPSPIEGTARHLLREPIGPGGPTLPFLGSTKSASGSPRRSFGTPRGPAGVAIL